MAGNGDSLIGKTLGQFEVIEEIGRGGMATVYRARQTSMNRSVAIKVLPRHLLHDPGFYERFEREVEVITQLEHPHILPIYDYGQVDGIPFIAMRYLGGGSLEQFMGKGGLPEAKEIEKALTQIAQALDHAHSQGIIHRDLKPGNIMLDEHGNAYLSDFGIARVLGSNMTGSMIVGTPAYMSPEQANGFPIDGRSDIYSLGVVMFELLTGREPYQAETPMAMLLKHINEPMPPLGNFRDDIPFELEAVVAKATEKDPDDRFVSAGEMMEAYSAALRGEETSISRPTRQEQFQNQATTQVPKSATTPAPIPTPTTNAMHASGQQAPITQQLPQQGRRNTMVIGLLVILLLVAVGAIALLLGGGGPPDNSNLLAMAPTAFPRASTIEQDLYSISIPDEWIPPALYYDQSATVSDHNDILHLWQDVNDDADASGTADAFVSLGMVRADLTTDVLFDTAVSKYEARHYSNDALFTFIDESIAENGTVRRSYFFSGDDEYTPGQVDVFYMKQEPYLAVLEMYTSGDSVNQFVPTMQLILDSLRIKSGV